jgi:hypothetical protein
LSPAEIGIFFAKVGELMAGLATSLPPQFDPKAQTTPGSTSFGGNDACC